MILKKVKSSILNILNDDVYLKLIYKRRFGKVLDLNNPIGFNAKLQWLKVNYRNQLLTICADKERVRDYVENTIGAEYLIPLIGTYKTWNDVSWDALPKRFAMKANNSSGMNIICMDKSELIESEAKKEASAWLKCNYFYMKREWQYKNIIPKIIVEELLIDSDGKVPSDIKIHCFKKTDGTFEFIIQVDVDRFTEHKQAYFDINWNQLDIEFSSKSFCTQSVLSQDHIKPAYLDEIIMLAKKLASPFCYSRIDFFLLDEKIYFGEVTFHHHSGFSHISSDWDLRLGSKINLELDFS